jgi:hypothetical protein
VNVQRFEPEEKNTIVDSFVSDQDLPSVTSEQQTMKVYSKIMNVAVQGTYTGSYLTKHLQSESVENE